MSSNNKNQNHKRSKKEIYSQQQVRLNAVQFLYQLSQDEQPFDYAKDQFTRFYLNQNKKIMPCDLELFDKIVTGTMKYKSDLDQLITENLSQNWKIDRIGEVAVAILRVGIFEIKHHTDIPASITINDYVTIAKSFFHEQEPGFINAVLDKISKGSTISI